MERCRVLAVDDDRDALSLIQLALEHDCDVVAISNAMQTPIVLDIVEPDIILLDIMMPKTSGFQLIDYIKKHQAYKDTPVVFLTAKGTVRDQQYGKKLGASLYVAKPFQPVQLADSIKGMFDKIGAERKAKALTMKEVGSRLIMNKVSWNSANWVD